MSRVAAVLAATCTAMVLVAFGVHRWRLADETERIARRLGVALPPATRWVRTEPLVRALPGLGALGRKADAAGGRLGATDLLLLWALLAYPLARAASPLFGSTAGPLLVTALLPVATWTALDAVARRRRDRVVAQLPDLVRHLAAGARAGLSLSGSLLHAANDIGEPTASELRRVVTAIELGTLPAAAVEQLAERLGSPDIDVLTNALAIQQRSGGDLVALLSRLADGLEAARRARREVRAITAGPGAQAYLAAALGLGGAALGNGVTDGGLDRALHKPLPALLFAVSVGLLLAAVLVIRRMTRIVE